MIIVNMDSTCVRSKSIYQYDYGTVLRLQGTKLPTAAEIQFSFEERGGQSKSRIGITKDGVTDVVIPDLFVENNFTSQDYKIYVFIYLTDENSSRTEYKITIPVKSRPQLEAFDKPEDAELFREAIAEVNKSAESASESARQALTAKDESVAAAKEARQSAQEASTSAQEAQTSVNESKESADAASNAAQASVTAKNIAVKAANSADSNALAASRSAQEAKQSAEQADTAAKSAAQSKQDIQTLKSEIDTTAEQIATDRTAVETDKKEVQKAKSDVEDLKEAVEQKSSESLVDIENAEITAKKNINDLKDVVIKKGNAAISGIETARDNAINDVNNAKDTAVNTIAQEEDSAVNDVNEAKDNAVAEINKNENVQQIKRNKDDIVRLAIKEEASGTGLMKVEDSAEYSMQNLKLYGKSVQTQTEGYNLWKGGELKVRSGNSTTGYMELDSHVVDLFKALPNGTYYVSYTPLCLTDGNIGSNTGKIIFNNVNRVEIVTADNKFEMTDDLREKIAAVALYGYYPSVINIVKNLMITNTPKKKYEPYTDEKQSPSFEYSQKIINTNTPKYFYT